MLNCKKVLLLQICGFICTNLQQLPGGVIFFQICDQFPIAVETAKATTSSSSALALSTIFNLPSNLIEDCWANC